MSKRMDRLFKAAEKLNEVVEGVRSVRWSAGGCRLKDTPEWVEFYVALARAREPRKEKVAT